MAVIDTETDEIIRMFETGPLPKMVATSPDGTRLAVTHWGNNTIGLLDISSDEPADWHYITSLIVDYQLKLNLSRTVSVDRDVNSGYCLRGTVFTPDGHYLLVGCMGGGGGIAVIDLTTNRYLGRAMGVLPNLRHLIIKNGYLFGSINRTGHIERIALQDFLDQMSVLDGDKHKSVTINNWEKCKIPAGAAGGRVTVHLDLRGDADLLDPGEQFVRTVRQRNRLPAIDKAGDEITSGQRRCRDKKRGTGDKNAKGFLHISSRISSL